MPETSTITQCRICGGSDLNLLVDYGDIPLAGGFLLPEERDQNRAYPLRLVVCANCSLMQVLDIIPPDEIFRKYSYASSTTRTLVNHFAQMGQDLAALAAAPGGLVVEFGCNDGVLLRPLREAGMRVVGVDPSDVARAASEKHGWPLWNEYFGPAVAQAIRAEHGPASIVTGNNTFAHTNDLHNIMQGISAVLDDEGFFVFEVHYQGDLLKLVQYDTVYHEHTCYYSLTALQALMRLHDFKLIDVMPIPIHAGSIRVTAARASSAHLPKSSVASMLADEATWDVGLFAQQVGVRRHTLRRLVADLRAAGRRVGAYGAAGRVTVLLNYCGLGPDMIDYVVDMSPLRYGRLVPGVLVPIEPPEHFANQPLDYAIMTAWNYEKEIVAKEQAFLTGGGRFIIPLPDIRLTGEA